MNWNDEEDKTDEVADETQVAEDGDDMSAPADNAATPPVKDDDEEEEEEDDDEEEEDTDTDVDGNGDKEDDEEA